MIIPLAKRFSWRAAVLAAIGIFLLAGSAPEAEAASTFGITTIGSQTYPPQNVGSQTTGTDLNLGSYLEADKYTIAVPLTAMTIYVYGTATGNAKVSIYSDNSGSPGTLLFTEVASPVTANTWTGITINNINLAAGTYWIAFNIDNNNVVTHSDTISGAVRLWQAYPYANAFPTTVTTAWTVAATGTQDNTYIVGVPVAGYAKATKVTLSPNNAAVTSLSLYSYNSGSAMLALYSDNSGPASLLWTSGSTAVSASSWNAVNVSAGTPASLTLSTGTYWLAWQWNGANAGPSYTAGSSGAGNSIAQAYGAFPASWFGGTSSSEQWSEYASYFPLPANASISAVAATSIKVAYSTTTPASNGYDVDASTASNFTGTIFSSSSLNSAAALTPQGLSPNTTYYLRAGALWGSTTYYISAVPASTSTLANTPASPGVSTFTAVGPASLTMRWSANGNPLNVTTYTVVLSTGSSYPNADAGNQILASTAPAGSLPTATISGLNSGTAYYLFVAAINNNGIVTSFTPLGSTTTLSNAPTFVNFTGISASGITFNFNGNSGAGALYQVVTSTAANPSAPAGAVVTTSSTYNTYLSSSGLSVNATYYFQVALLTNGVPGAYSTAQGTSTLANAPSNPVFSSVSAGSITVTWTPVPAGSAASYLLQASTASNFSGTVYSSTTANTALGALTVAGLWANTTYYFQVAGLNWDSIPSYQAWGGSTATLALPPSRLTSDYLAVYYTSATLQWAALPLSPSSQTCEGYLLEASTAPNFTGTIYSSATPNAALSTLTISGLNLANTYYFQVGSINPESVWNPRALTQLNMQLSESTAALSLGAMDPTVYSSTISISSFVVTNYGSLPVTLVIWASTMTQPSSPWTLGLAPASETVLLQGVWNSVAPSSGQFNTAITNSTTTSTGSNYAGNQTGVSVPPGQSRTMWFQFWRPSSTVSNAKQSIQINAQAVYP